MEEIRKEIRGACTEEDLLRTAAWVLNEHPLFRYQPDDSTLTVLLVGDSPIRSKFLQLILACAQMSVPGAEAEYRRLCIQVMTDRPETVYRELDDCGDLREYLAVEDLTGPKPQKKSAGSGPFATVVIRKKNPHKLARQIAKEFSYAILLEEEPGKNAAVAAEVCDLLQKESGKDASADGVQSGKLRRAILVGQLPVDGAAVEKSGMLPELRQVTCSTFALNGSDVDAERAFREKLEAAAFAVHTYYTKEQNQRVGQRHLRRTFGAYENQYSSIRSVLTIPYKLRACGVDSSENPGKALCDLLEAYDRDPAGRHPRLQTLLHMEHRSWMCFAMIRGWCAPDLKLLKKQAFTENHHGYKLTNVQGKNYHPCLVDSRPGQKQLLPLESYSRSAWEEGRIDAGLDSLDQRSLELHRICAHRVAEWENKDEGSYRDLFAALREKATAVSGQAYRRACDLEVVGNKLLRRQTQTDALWHRIVTDLTGLLQADPEALAALEALRFPMQLVLERNAYRDYKRTDLDLIRAIPEILQPKPMETLYTLLSDTDWCNVVAAILAEPRQLVLLYQPDTQAARAEECRERYQAFFDTRVLTEENGVQDRAVTVTCQPVCGGEFVRHSALDITGAAPRLLHRALQERSLKELPAVCYEQGRLRGLTEDGPLWSIYNGHNRSLNVAETMLLGGNADLSDRLENDLLAGNESYRSLWEAAFSGSAKQWNLVTGHIADHAEAEVPVNTVLEELVRRKILQSTEEGWARIGQLQSYIDRAPDLKARYELREVLNWSDPGRPAYVIRVRDCAFQSTFSETESLEKSLRKLEETGLIRQLDLQKNNRVYRCQFTFANEAVRDWLLKAGNVLELFAYHVVSDSGLFDDVRPNVYIHWADGGVGASRQTTNEVDLICTKGVRTCFISCKKTEKLEQSHYDQIWYQAHRLGVDAVPVLLYAGSGDGGNDTHISRGKRMGVETIVLSPKLSADAAAVQLEQKLRQILG